MNRRLHGILLLMLMFFNTASPLIPHIRFYLKKAYIEKNLCENRGNPEAECHGKCCLKKSIVTTNEENSSPDSKKNNKSEKPAETEYIAPDETATSPHPIGRIFLTRYIINPSLSGATGIFIPPEFKT